jgi:hypothetical protein
MKSDGGCLAFWAHEWRECQERGTLPGHLVLCCHHSGLGSYLEHRDVPTIFACGPEAVVWDRGWQGFLASVSQHPLGLLGLTGRLGFVLPAMNFAQKCSIGRTGSSEKAFMRYFRIASPEHLSLTHAYNLPDDSVSC